MKTANPIAKIAKYTLLDEIRQRSFVVMFAICVAFVFLARGCYQGNYVVNGEALDAATVVAAVSKAAFHVIAVVTMLIAALLSMRTFRRDRDGGMQSAILSKPITRRQYVLGKVVGLWVLSAVFMLILQAIVLLTVVISAKVVIPGYPVAALLCCLNLFFVVVAGLLLSLLMPETAAFLCILGIVVVGLIIDGINALGSSQMTQTMTDSTQTDFSLGKVLYYVWPKLSGMQYFASSFIGGGGFRGLWSVYPLFNILLYCLIFCALLLWRFRKEEIV
jgi:ABC-type transport system involved in multi-copper enzyme maturation permease subunit